MTSFSGSGNAERRRSPFQCFYCRRVSTNRGALGGSLRVHRTENRSRRSWNNPGSSSNSVIGTGIRPNPLNNPLSAATDSGANPLVINQHHVVVTGTRVNTLVSQPSVDVTGTQFNPLVNNHPGSSSTGHRRILPILSKEFSLVGPAMLFSPGTGLVNTSNFSGNSLGDARPQATIPPNISFPSGSLQVNRANHVSSIPKAPSNITGTISNDFASPTPRPITFPVPPGRSFDTPRPFSVPALPNHSSAAPRPLSVCSVPGPSSTPHPVATFPTPLNLSLSSGVGTACEFNNDNFRTWRDCRPLSPEGILHNLYYDDVVVVPNPYQLPRFDRSPIPSFLQELSPYSRQGDVDPSSERNASTSEGNNGNYLTDVPGNDNSTDASEMPQNEPLLLFTDSEFRAARTPCANQEEYPGDIDLDIRL